MNPTHIHLLITHLPIFGSILGAFVLAYGLKFKSHATMSAAYWVLIMAAVGAGIAYNTGEAAEETVENIAGVSENAIEAHEDAAKLAIISFIVLGISAICALVFQKLKPEFSNKIAVAVLLIALFGFGMVARTGFLGGKIRHTEIDNKQITLPSNYQNGQNPQEDDDD